VKCLICGKKGVQLSHFPKVHGSILAKRSAAARARKKGSSSHARVEKEYAAVLEAGGLTGLTQCPRCGLIYKG
jgi:hypothetical protein